MPTLQSHPALTTVKLLLVGDSGTGKTSALASLANAGYKLIIADFDNGLDVLTKLVAKDKQQNVIFETFTDTLRPGPTGLPMVQGPSQYNKFVQYLQKWPDLGEIAKLDSSHIFVIDSATFLGESAMRHVLMMAGRNGQQPWQADWGTAMRLQESIFSICADKSFLPNVIMTMHLTSTREGKDDKGESVMSDKLYPAALGNKLPPKVGRFFNAMLLARAIGSRRVISTVPMNNVDVKTALAPGAVPNELPLDRGLVQFFEAYKESKQ